MLVPLIIQGQVDAQLQVAVPDGAQQAWSTAGQPVRHASASQETVEAILGKRFAQNSGNTFPGASIQAVPTRVGAVVAFEGARVFHRVSPLGASTEPWAGSWAPPASPSVSGTREALSVCTLSSSSPDSTPAQEGAAAEEPLRVVLSMTFTTDPSSTLLSTYQRRLKDMTYFGLLAALFG